MTVTQRKLAGKRAIVTGANGTFGRLLCQQLAAAGATVVGLDLVAGTVSTSTPQTPGPKTVGPQAPGPTVPVLACDLTDAGAVVGQVATAIDLLGGLDLLVNNAGVGGPAPAEVAPGDVVRHQLEVNLMAAWHTTAASIAALERSRGRVVFVASRMALLPLPLAAAYGVSKRALVAYADTLRLEVGSHIGVSVIYPSMVASPIHESTVHAGLSLAGVSRFEPAEGVVAAILRAATARRAPRDVATTWRGRVELAIARHLPAVTAAIVRRTVRRRVGTGDFDRAPLAAGLLRRAGRQSEPGAPNETR